MNTHLLSRLFTAIDDEMDAVDRSNASLNRLLVRALRRVTTADEARRLVELIPNEHPYAPLVQALYDDLAGNPPHTPPFPMSN
ncbi:MAG TPA: hypothetical protein ENG84_03560 [Gammaproteobacteria bacterium]|nr:hypothetical protein BMS3Bbin13_00106 [bacterium BMS3Bbin13]HDK02903.1 hypothetical protein [Gammaproteobacteria bacterium]